MKPKSKDEPGDDEGPSMVPDGIKNGVITELMRHETDTKGKKKTSKPYQAVVAQRKASAQAAMKTGSDVMITGSDVVSSSTSFSSNGSPSSSRNESKDSQNGVLNNSHNSSGFQPVTPPSDSSSDSGAAFQMSSSPHSTDQCLQDSYQYSDDKSSPHVHSPSEADPIIRSSMDMTENTAYYIPTSHGLDMPGPPNAVAPECSLPPSVMERLRNKVKAEAEPPHQAIPPNQVAPASDPIPHSISPTQPLTVHIPNALLSPKSAASNMYGPPPPMAIPVNTVPWHHQATKPGVDEYTQYSRDVPANSGRPGMQNHGPGGDSINLDRVFPFPIVAESPMMLSTIPSYSDSYQSGLKPGAQGAPAPYGRDQYHPLMISSFNNPYYTQDPSMWGRNFQQPQQPF